MTELAAKPPRFIISPWSDTIFIIGSPVLGAAVVCAAYQVSGCGPESSKQMTCATVGAFSQVLTLSHLFLVFFRSHGNARVFRSYPWRFYVAPIVVAVNVYMSSIAAILAILAVTWWDVYHSSLQTFGLGRIYDARAGNDPRIGRRADYWLNLFLYAGPILGGVNFSAHLYHPLFDIAAVPKIDMNDARSAVVFLGRQVYPATMAAQPYIAYSLATAFALFLIYYLLSLRADVKSGYRISVPKVVLYVTTGVVSLVSWGYVAPRQGFISAFWIMNMFHAVQYFALVFKSEGGNLAKLFGLDRGRGGKTLTCALVGALCLGFGAAAYAGGTRAMFALAVTVSLMHFWYDGFIWSVRKNEV